MNPLRARAESCSGLSHCLQLAMELLLIFTGHPNDRYFRDGCTADFSRTFLCLCLSLVDPLAAAVISFGKRGKKQCRRLLRFLRKTRISKNEISRVKARKFVEFVVGGLVSSVAAAFFEARHLYALGNNDLPGETENCGIAEFWRASEPRGVLHHMLNHSFKKIHCIIFACGVRCQTCALRHHYWLMRTRSAIELGSPLGFRATGYRASGYQAFTPLTHRLDLDEPARPRCCSPRLQPQASQC